MTPGEAPAPELARNATPAPRAEARLRHLFRGSLGSGRIHPLYLPVLRYRQAQAGEAAIDIDIATDIAVESGRGQVFR